MSAIDFPARFPRIPHLPGSTAIDDDRVLPADAVASLCRSCLVVAQEKLDGANVGVMIDGDGKVVCLKRAGVVGARRERPEFGFFRAWAFERADILVRVLGTRWTAYGELLWLQHSIRYTTLPDWVIFFDLLDRQTGLFACAAEVSERLGARFAIVPTVFVGNLDWPCDPGRRFAGSLAKSAFGESRSEGLVLRFEREGQLIARVKYRSPGFEPGKSLCTSRNTLAPQ